MLNRYKPRAFDCEGHSIAMVTVMGGSYDSEGEDEDEIYLRASQQYEESPLSTVTEPPSPTASVASADDNLCLQASQQYEELMIPAEPSPTSVSVDTEDPFPISLATMMKYEELGEGAFSLDSLLYGGDDHEGRHSSQSKRRFANPVSESDILSKINDAVPRSTRKTTLWAVNMHLEELERAPY